MPAASTHEELSRAVFSRSNKIPPRHLKHPTPPGEELANALYKTARDFFPNMGVTRLSEVVSETGPEPY